MTVTWTVYVSWRATSDGRADETFGTFSDWPTARRNGRQVSCFDGVRYITILDPDHIVTADYDRYTNRWREYALHIGACDNYVEPDGPACDGQLYARPTDVQVRCPRCGAVVGARGYDRRPFDPAVPA